MPNAIPTRLTTLFAAATIVMTGANAAVADTTKMQVNLTSELNALVHEAAASVCMINAGVAVDAEMRSLGDARQQFNNTLADLIDQGTVKGDDRVEAKWFALDEAFSMILVGDNPADYIDAIVAEQASLEQAIQVVHDRAAQAHSQISGVTSSEMLTVNLAERQEVLVQKMKLMACELTNPATGADVQAELKDAMDVYEVTLAALTTGVPEMGIAAPGSYAANQVLAASTFDWQSLRPVLATIADNGSASTDDLVGLHGRTAALDTRMSNLVDLYVSPVSTGDVPQVASLEGTVE